MCLILLTTFLYVFSSVQGDYGDIYQMSRNISVSNFDGRVIMTEIESSMLKYTYDNIHMDQFLVLMIILQSRCYQRGIGIGLSTNHYAQLRTIYCKYNWSNFYCITANWIDQLRKLDLGCSCPYKNALGNPNHLTNFGKSSPDF